MGGAGSSDAGEPHLARPGLLQLGRWEFVSLCCSHGKVVGNRVESTSSQVFVLGHRLGCGVLRGFLSMFSGCSLQALGVSFMYARGGSPSGV